MRGPGGEGARHRWGEWCARGSRLKCKRAKGSGKCVHVRARRTDARGKRTERTCAHTHAHCSLCPLSLIS